MAGIEDFFRLVGKIRRLKKEVFQKGSFKMTTKTSSPLNNKLEHNSLATVPISKLPKNFSIGLVCLLVFSIFIFPANVFSAEKEISLETNGGISKEVDEFLGGMDIRELMQQDVTINIAGKKPELVHKAASAVYVLTGEDIRRSGAVNIMEALRMVPGVLVSKLNQNRYAISIRGFNQRLGSDKLLVLIDGRSVYSPVASGVFWIGQDTVLEDIDRIEVIRGPGAALWGSNAVAGVINIITKSAEDTQGGLIAGGVGTEEQGFATLRFGGKIDEDFNYRVYGKYRDRDDGIAANGNDAFDDKQIGQGGFRSDWKINEQDKLTMQGDYYRLNSDLDFTSRFVALDPPFGINGSTPFQGTNVQEGANFLTRWTHTNKDKSFYALQMYYDRLKRKSGVPFDNVVDQFDIDFQHNLYLNKDHNFSWGMNYRYTFFDLETTAIIQNTKKDTHLASLFLHDEIQLIPKKLNLILGVKAEYNVFTGVEWQPSVRTAWNPSPDHTFWAGFSRAVRLPTVSDENVMINRALIPGAPPLLIRSAQNSGVKAEELLAYEIGYRVKATDKINFDITAFYFDYDNLIVLTDGAVGFNPFPAPGLLTVGVFNDNSATGEIYGLEISGQWQVRSNWRLSGSYSFADTQLHPIPGAPVSDNTFQEGFEAEGEPEHIFNLRSYWNVSNNVELDTFYYYVSENNSRSIPAYSRLDIRLGWQPMEGLDLSFTAQNLLDESHPELSELLEVNSETQRSYYLKATLKF